MGGVSYRVAVAERSPVAGGWGGGLEGSACWVQRGAARVLRWNGVSGGVADVEEMIQTDVEEMIHTITNNIISKKQRTKK